ncbi:MAG: hypothetical protein AMXMBFR64_04160 [Myxococcales bacterium]
MADSPVRSLLLRLASELAKERAVAERISDEVLEDACRMESSPDDPALERAHLAVVAVGLHRWYTAVEAIVERVERALGTMPTGAEWHSELLAGATLDITGVRPAILPEACADPLRSLLKFRHFFRHAYAVQLDGAKLRGLVADLRAVGQQVHAALAAFEAFLRAAADDLNEPDSG